jgi:hypothetical protein
MLGPLPPLHRLVLCALTLLTCTGLGAWLGYRLVVPLLPSVGAVIGSALGLVLVALLLNEPPHARPARRSQRHRHPR